MSTALAPIAVDVYREKIGQLVGVSRWFELSQERIDRFAELTEDMQFIHIDPVAAADTPFGGTVAHGYLTLSMLSAMAYDAIPPLANAELGVNYGFNRLRFVSPVRAGKRVRAHFTLNEVSDHPSGAIQSLFAVSMEIEGDTKPALIAEWLTLQYVTAV